MSTRAWQIGQHFVMFQELFEQTMVQCNIRYNGPILNNWNKTDERCYLPIHFMQTFH